MSEPPADIAHGDQMEAALSELQQLATRALQSHVDGGDWERHGQQMLQLVGALDASTVSELLCRACTSWAAHIIEHHM